MTANKETIAIFGKDFDISEFRLLAFYDDFKDGYAILEMFDENRFMSIPQIRSLKKPLNEKYMISGVLFDGEKQLKFRRIRDNLMRGAADFQIAGWEPVRQKETLSVQDRHLILWGYKNEKLEGFLYEERIPYLFEYPGGLNIGERERLEILMKEYHAKDSSAIWSRFLGIRKTEMSHGKQKEKENKQG